MKSNKNSNGVYNIINKKLEKIKLIFQCIENQININSNNLKVTSLKVIN